MKYLKKYNENMEYKELSEEDIRDLFIHTIDNCTNFEIEKYYFASGGTEQGEWYPEDGADDPPENSTRGFVLHLHYEEITDSASLEKYKELIINLSDDIFRLEGLNKNYEIYLDFTQDQQQDSITIAINSNIKI